MLHALLLVLIIPLLAYPQEQHQLAAALTSQSALMTERCYLRPTKPKEHAAFARAMSFDEVLCYYLFGKPTSVIKAQRYFNNWFNKNSIKLFLKLFNTKHNKPAVWTILEQESDTIVGFIGLHKIYKNVNAALSIYHKNNYDLSVTILPEHQGKRLSAEVVNTFVDAFFKTKRYKKSPGLTLLVHANNTRAISCLKDTSSNSMRYGIQEQGKFMYKYSRQFIMEAYTLSRGDREEFCKSVKDVNVVL